MSEIRHTLELVRTKLNDFLLAAAPNLLAPDRLERVVLSNLVDQEGRANERVTDRLVMYLANLQRENFASSFNPNVPVQDTRYIVVTPPIFIDAFILFYANYLDKNYATGLEVIAQAISFFQQYPWFTHDNLPGLDPQMEKLTFEFMNLEMIDLNYVMGMAGVKYLPSIFYKVRMFPFRNDAIQSEQPAVLGPDSSGGSQSPAGLIAAPARRGPARSR